MTKRRDHEVEFWEALEDRGIPVVSTEDWHGSEMHDPRTVVHHYVPRVPHIRTGKPSKFELDFCVPGLKLYVELDGYGEGHKSWGAFHRDRAKDRAMLFAGWRGMRYGTGDLKNRDFVDKAAEEFVKFMELYSKQPNT